MKPGEWSIWIVIQQYSVQFESSREATEVIGHEIL